MTDRLTAADRLVGLVDLNAAPTGSDNYLGTLNQLFYHPSIDCSTIPMQPNGSPQTVTPELRVDYVLPLSNMEIGEVGLFCLICVSRSRDDYSLRITNSYRRGLNY
ncbi:MAG: hypothetical protein P8N76_10910 [Pirellulaceae bacterium]|nr:hypothetical protein [Pirellulaceae bacterium]